MLQKALKLPSGLPPQDGNWVRRTAPVGDQRVLARPEICRKLTERNGKNSASQTAQITARPEQIPTKNEPNLIKG